MTVFNYRLSSRSQPISVADYRKRARRAVPDMVWAWVDYGADDHVTLDANRAAYGRYALRTQVLTGTAPPDLGTTVAGQHLRLPVLLAPTGLVGLSHWTGELGVAQAAERAGTLSIVSTPASYTFEEVAEGTERDHFFQLYPSRKVGAERNDLDLSLMNRGKAAGYPAIFVTVDAPMLGNREAERKRGMGRPPTLTPRRALSAAMRPKWGWNLVKHGRISGRNMVNARGARAAMKSLDIQFNSMVSDLSWDDLSRLRDHWDGPLFVKGILDADDAERAVDRGADGIVVSNHGGRQMECAAATLDALPAVVARVGARAEVLLDGGIRRGTDVVKALCLGAKAVCIGRPYLYGIAAAGPPGVEHVINILHEEITRTLALMGVTTLSDLRPDWLLPASQQLGDYPFPSGRLICR